MLRPKTIALVNQRRTLRALYAQTQAYPYAAILQNTGSDVDANGVPNQADTSQIALTDVAGNSSIAAIWPGAVMELFQQTVGASALGELVTLGEGTNRPFGLCANFVGGNMDELNGRREVGVWRGRGGVFEVLAPVFVSTITGTDDLGASSIGQLTDLDTTDATALDNRVARPLNFLSERALIVELLVGG